MPHSETGTEYQIAKKKCSYLLLLFSKWHISVSNCLKFERCNKEVSNYLSNCSISIIIGWFFHIIALFQKLQEAKIAVFEIKQWYGRISQLQYYKYWDNWIPQYCTVQTWDAFFLCNGPNQSSLWQKRLLN